MCLAQGPQSSDAGEARTRGPSARVKHFTTEPLRSHNDFVRINKIKDITAINRKTGQHVKKTFSYASRTTGMKLQFSCQIILKQINNLKLT